MPSLNNYLSPRCVRAKADVSSKKRALKLASTLIHESYPFIPANEVLDGLIQRERLGSTALGNGIAIPHCRSPYASDAICVMLQLKEGVDFDATDNQAVDLVFVLIVPEDAHDDHLQLLALLAEKLSNEAFRDKLRAADEDGVLYQCAISES